MAQSALVLLRLIENRRRDQFPEVELNDVRTGKVDGRLTGRAQSATCLLCRKTIVAWPGRPPGKRRGLYVPNALELAIVQHVPACADAWLWKTLARWSTGFAREAEREAIAKWRDQNFGVDVRSMPGTRERIAALFARLPQPPGSEMAQEIEVALIAISRAWQH